jgi:hypothetical protein
MLSVKSLKHEKENLTSIHIELGYIDVSHNMSQVGFQGLLLQLVPPLPHVSSQQYCIFHIN